MSLGCAIDDEDYDPTQFQWVWLGINSHEPLSTKQSRKCTSCKKRIRPGDLACKIPRERVPKNDIEQRIYDKDCEGGMVPLAPWYYCERCGHQGIALIELEYAWSLTDDNMQDMIDEYRVSYQGQEIAC